ncbi:hypothetical protein D3C81_1834110 [compost metagenome]
MVAAGVALRAGRFWLHHCRHLPAADGEKCRFATADRTPVVAGWHRNHSGVFRLAMGGETLGSPAMPDRQSADPKRLRGVNTCQRLVVPAGSQQYRFWRNLYGNHLTGDAARPPTQRAAKH